MIYDELAARISEHVDAAHGESVALTVADFVVSFDSGPGRLRRTVVLDANDDGYFLTVVAQYDGDLLAAVAYRGDGDQGFVDATCRCPPASLGLCGSCARTATRARERRSLPHESGRR